MAGTIEPSEVIQDVPHIPFNQILESIAKGVETRFVRTVVANIVIIETVRVARKMHIPEEEIQEWRSSRCYKKNITHPTTFEINSHWPVNDLTG